MLTRLAFGPSSNGQDSVGDRWQEGLPPSVLEGLKKLVEESREPLHVALSFGTARCGG
jgi:hypothetical protein